MFFQSSKTRQAVLWNFIRDKLKIAALSRVKKYSLCAVKEQKDKETKTGMRKCKNSYAICNIAYNHCMKHIRKGKCRNSVGNAEKNRNYDILIKKP